MSDEELEIINFCFNCNEECNPMSQICGRCARNPSREPVIESYIIYYKNIEYGFSSSMAIS